MRRKNYSNEFKSKVALEALQRDTTIEQVRQKYGVHTTQINHWTKQLRQNIATVFNSPGRSNKTPKAQSIDELQRIVGKLAVENEILKKALESLD